MSLVSLNVLKDYSGNFTRGLESSTLLLVEGQAVMLVWRCSGLYYNHWFCRLMAEEALTEKEDKIFLERMISLVVILYVACLCIRIAHIHGEVNLIFLYIPSFLHFPALHQLTATLDDILMRTRDPEAIFPCSITENSPWMGHWRSQWDHKEELIPECRSFQSPLSSTCAFEPSTLPLRYVAAQDRRYLHHREGGQSACLVRLEEANSNFYTHSLW